MNSQELRNLQEAYMEVVEKQQINEISIELAKRAGELRMNRTFDIMQKDWKEGRKKPSPEYLKSYNKFQDDKRRYERKLNKEQVDIYDIILSHLLDEGYAETPEAAEVIMVNMSEEWRYSIIDESRGEDLRAKYGDNPSATLDKRAFSAAIRGKTGTQRRKTLLGLSGRASIRSRGEMPQGDQEIRSRGGARRTFGSDENRDRGTKEERFAAFAQGKRNSPNITDTERRFRHGR